MGISDNAAVRPCDDMGRVGMDDQSDSLKWQFEIKLENVNGLSVLVFVRGWWHIWEIKHPFRVMRWRDGD